MKLLQLTFLCLCTLWLFACSSTAKSTPTGSTDANAEQNKPISRSEAKSEACPPSLLEAGATPEDCLCIEGILYDLGQVPGALSPNGSTPKALFGNEDGIRKIAIGLLRHDAIEQCGLFEPDHEVAKNL